MRFISHSNKRDLYYKKAMHLYFEEGMCGTHICKVLPISRTILYKWIAIFAGQNPQVASMKGVKQVRKASKPSAEVQEEELPKTVLELQSEFKKLRAQLDKVEIKAEAYDEIINVAEAKFNIFASCLAYRSRHNTNTTNQRFWSGHPGKPLPWNTSGLYG